MQKGERIGRFTLSYKAIQEKPEFVKKVMGTVIIIRAEFLYHSYAIEYEAICEDFDIVKENDKIPWYKPTIDDNKVIWIKEKGDD